MRDHRECTRKNLRKNFAFNLGLTLFLFLMVLPFSAGATIFPFNSPDGEEGDYFGFAVAVDGDYAVFGATGAGDENGGRAYVYQYDGTNWQLIQELNPGIYDSTTNTLKPKESNGGDLFGQTVDISGDYIIIGAPGDDTMGGDAGKAYVYKRNLFTNIWEPLTNNVLPLLNSEGAKFGSSVALYSASSTEAYVVVGAESDSPKGSESGSVYFFYVENTAIFSNGNRLYPAGGTSDDFFGKSVSISQTTDGRFFSI
ncbi:MAG: hypothetical protein ACOC0H_02015, partial [Thermodesulfobacteriota bacterium]